MFPTKENQEKLDEVFKTFYLKIRLLNFIFKTIYYSAINYNKKIRKHKQRYLLILDKSVQNTPEDDGISIIDLVPSSERTPDEWMIEKNNVLEEVVSDPLLNQAIKLLTPKEKLIVELAYIHAMSDRTISQKLGVSHQAICKTRKRAITKIRRHMEEKYVV